MSIKAMTDLIQKLLHQSDACEAFLNDPTDFVSKEGIDVPEEVVQSLASLSAEDFESIRMGGDVTNEKLVIKAKGPVEVICACGGGYYAG